MCNVTTGIGLASLGTSDLEPIRKFGIYSAAGVALMLIFLFLFLPAALHIWPIRPRRTQGRGARPSGRPGRAGRRHDLVRRVLAALWQRDHPASCGGAVACFAFIFVVGLGPDASSHQHRPVEAVRRKRARAPRLRLARTERRPAGAAGSRGRVSGATSSALRAREVEPPKRRTKLSFLRAAGVRVADAADDRPGTGSQRPQPGGAVAFAGDFRPADAGGQPRFLGAGPAARDQRQAGRKRSRLERSGYLRDDPETAPNCGGSACGRPRLPIWTTARL